jgi:hypothetical protein
MVSKEFVERIESYVKTLVDALFDMKPLEIFIEEINTLMRVIIIDDNETIMTQNGYIIIRVVRSGERMLIVIEHWEMVYFVPYRVMRLNKAILNEMFRRLGVEMRAILYRGGEKRGLRGKYGYHLFLKRGKTYYVPVDEGFTKIYENEKVTIISTSGEAKLLSKKIISLKKQINVLREKLMGIKDKLNFLYHDPRRAKDREKIKELMDKIDFLSRKLIHPKNFNLPPIDDEIIIKELEKAIEETSKALEEVRREYIKIKSKTKRKRK